MKMRTTFIGHASILVETQKSRILTDPWWKTPCFGNSWWIYPPAKTDAVYFSPIDYIYISHGHHDHLHYPTLGTLHPDAKVVVAKSLGLSRAIRDATKRDVLEVTEDEPIQLDEETEAWIWPTVGGDSLMVIRSQGMVLLNLNDALHSAPQDIQETFIDRLRKTFGTFDYAFCGYGIASHFPNCYRVPGKDDASVAARRQRHFNSSWARIMARLEPRFAFPFAANVVFLDDDLFALNAVVHNGQRPLEALPEGYCKNERQAIDIAPGFCIEDHRIISNIQFSPTDLDKLANEMALEKTTVNEAPPVADSIVEALKVQLDRNIALCLQYLQECPLAYKFIIELRGAQKVIVVKKDKSGIQTHLVDIDAPSNQSFDVKMTSKVGYLQRSLTKPYGDEILFVGSGCRFVYQSADLAKMNVHNELKIMVSHHEAPPRSRYGDQSRLLYEIKTAIKALFGRRTSNLYDLGAWLS